MFPIHVAAVQYATEMYDKTHNTDKAIHLLDKAAHLADLVLLPEISFTGYWLGKDMKRFAEPVPGPLTTIVSQIAVTRNAWICFGLAEREGDKIYNTAVLIGADGNIVGKHRKVHLFQADLEAGFSPGNELSVFETSLGRIGILVCYDAFHIESIRVLDLKGAQIVLMPSVGLSAPDEIEDTMRSWEIVLTANSKFGRCYVVWANKIGKDNNLICIGNSMILDPNGNIIARGGTEEEIVRAQIQLEPKMPREGRRPELYTPICTV
ncbi:MAG: carbon-nitrogen hydrolase family protein [Armatimonadota bacterium]|nr:carbon-nitrogen hydrolase family protein [Armatimonadota bacterium]